MKKRLVAILLMVFVLMITGCGNSNSAEEPNETDSQMTENAYQTDTGGKRDISIEEAENILQEYLISVNNWESNYVLEPLEPVLGEIENEEIFRFEIRYTDDTDEVGGRLIDNYTITTDGEKILWYNSAGDEWVQQIGNGVVDNTVLDQDTNAKNIIEAVLLGDAQFLYVSDGNTEAIGITDIPSLFDADDPYMKIWKFFVVDLDRDGEEEVILFVIGVAGDMGGKIILHQIGDEVYGYACDNRTLEELKTDGTFGFSDPTGVAEGGIGIITDFSEFGYTIDKISYGTGTYEGWNTFIVDHQPATEEEYFDAVAIQNKKADVEWYDFTNENIIDIF